jgi:hypothetical protein
MNRLDAMLQPGETVAWRNRPGLGIGALLLIGLALAAVFAAAMAWLGGGWESLWREPYRLVPLAALPLLGGYALQDALVVTDRWLLITRGLLRRTVAEVDRADILSAAVIKSVPYFGKVVTVRFRDTTAVRLYRPDTAGATALGRDEIGTFLSDGAEAMCAALNRPETPSEEGSTT